MYVFDIGIFEEFVVVELLKFDGISMGVNLSVCNL